jgi:hypothetical protein
MGFHDVYELLMYCLQYLTNAKYLISGKSITSKPMLMISSACIYIWT